ARARQEVMPRIVRAPRADVTERIDDALVRQNAIGRHQFFENKIKLAHHPLLGPAPRPHMVCSGSTSRDSTVNLRYGRQTYFREISGCCGAEPLSCRAE